MASENAKLRVGRVAARAWGRLTLAQLNALGITSGTIGRWVRDGYLHPRLPGVYAVGHAAVSYHARLAEALLYAGPGAMLSHATAAHWLGLLEARPTAIHVSTPRRCRSRPGVVVHQRRSCERMAHHGFPVTVLPQLFLDLAVEHPVNTVRLALARAEFKEILDLSVIEAVLGRGRPGSATLRAALRAHEPELAHTRSELERALIRICERGRLVIPRFNVRIAGWTVDAVWWAERLVVEVDGYNNHRSAAQIRRDRQKEMEVRGAGFGVLRYSSAQVFDRPADVEADLQRAGAPSRPARSA